MSFFNPYFKWNFFLNQINIRERSKARTLILINDELDLASLNAIKNFTNCSKKVVKVRSLTNSFFENKKSPCINQRAGQEFHR